MKIEVTILMSVLAVIVAAAGLFMNIKKNNKGDSFEGGRFAEKLDNFGKDQKEMKEDVRAIRDGVNEMQRDVIALRIRLDNVEKEVYKKGETTDES